MDNWRNQIIITQQKMTETQLTQYLMSKNTETRRSVQRRDSVLVEPAVRAVNIIKIARQQDNNTKTTYMIKNQENLEVPKKPFNTKMIAKINNQHNPAPIKNATTGSTSSKSSKSSCEYERASTIGMDDDSDLESPDQNRWNKKPNSCSFKLVLEKTESVQKKSTSPIASAAGNPEDEIEEVEDANDPEETTIAIIMDTSAQSTPDSFFGMESANTSPDDPNQSVSQGRNMRSQNPGFNIVRQCFINQFQSNTAPLSDTSEAEEEVEVMSEKSRIDLVVNRKRDIEQAVKPGSDHFCWRCHIDGLGIQIFNCNKCVRSYHGKCLKSNQIPTDALNFLCPACVDEEAAKEANLIKTGMRKLDLELLKKLLEFALDRMELTPGKEIFDGDFDKTIYADIDKYIVHPVTLNSLRLKLKVNKFHTLEAFENEAKFIHHNSNIYPNITKYKLIANTIVKICRQEVSEIETCPECYFNANTLGQEWFVAICSKPHLPLWAKLKGFPFWPAKAMTTTSAGLVDVRFFGAHDRAWVPLKECVLYSENPPSNVAKNKRSEFLKCLEELKVYVKNLSRKYGEFQFAPPKTLYDPNNEVAQLQLLLPGYLGSPKTESNNKKLRLKFVKTASTGEFMSVNENEREDITETDRPTTSQPFVMSESPETIKTTVKAKASKLKTEKPKKQKLLQKLLNKTVEDAEVAVREFEENSEVNNTNAEESTDKVINKRGSTKRTRNVKSFDAAKRKKSFYDPSITIPIKKREHNPVFDRTTRSKSTQSKSRNDSINVDSGLNERPVYTGPINLLPFNVKIERMDDDENIPSQNGQATENEKSVGQKARKTFPNNGKFINLPNQPNMPFQSPQCQSILNQYDGMVLVPAQNSPAVPPSRISVVPSRSLLNAPEISSGVEIPGPSFTPSTEEPITNGNAHSNNLISDIPAMPQLSALVVPSSRNAFPSLPDPSSHIRNLYSNHSTSLNLRNPHIDENVVFGNGNNNTMLAAQSHRLADFFRTMLQDFLENMVNTETPLLEAKVKLLELENEKLQEDMIQLKAKAAADLQEQKSKMTKEREAAIALVRQQCEDIRLKSVELAIKDLKQQAICAFCGKEAQFYCCTNTSYCNEECQSVDWRKHMLVCERSTLPE